METGDKVVVTDRGVVRTILLNRQEKKNALDASMYPALIGGIKEAARDEGVRILVVTGTGEYFSSGNDLGNFLTAVSSGITPEDMAEQGKAWLHDLVKELIDFPKILVAAVNGPALGILFTTLPLFDLVFASPTATFSAPFSKLGQVPEGCSTITFPLLMGHSLATQVLLFGRVMTAEEAKNKGIVTEIVTGDLMEAVYLKLEELVRLPRGSLEAGKRLLRGGRRKEELHRVNREECEVLVERWLSQECMEAVLNFFEEKSRAKL